jgi:hypothetical protein
MADFSSLSTVWQAYQAEDSFLPFYIPLTVWITTFLHTKVGSNDKKIEFHRWYTIHNLHNFGAIALGLTSMFFNDDAVFDERIPILWSISYFCVDLVDCAMRKDLTYSAHAVFCLVLGMANYQTPICRQLRMKYVLCLTLCLWIAQDLARLSLAPHTRCSHLSPFYIVPKQHSVKSPIRSCICAKRHADPSTLSCLPPSLRSAALYGYQS